MGPLSVPVLMSGGFTIASLLTASNGFYFDFTSGATGAGIASVTSVAPSTKTAAQGTGSKQPVWTDAASDYASFDGIDDWLLSDLLPSSAMTIGFCGRIGGNSQVMIGSTTAAANRAGNLGTNATGLLSAGWGAQSQAVIAAGSSITGTDVVGIVRCSATRVELSLNGASIYDAAADISTAPNTTVGYGLGAVNTEGTAANFVAGRLYRAFVVQSFVSDAQVLPLARALGSGVVSI